MPNSQNIALTVPADLLTLIKQAVRNGDYASDNELICELLRQWKIQYTPRQKAVAELRRTIDEGLAGQMRDNFDVEELIERANRGHNAIKQD